MANLISIGQLIDQTWDHYTKFFKILMRVSLWALVLPPLMIIRIFLTPDGEVNTLAALLSGQGDLIAWVGVFFGAIVSLLVIPIVTIWIYINLVKVIEAQDQKKSVSLQSLRAYGWKTFFSYLYVAVIKSIITLLPLLLLVPGMALIWTNIFYDGGATWGVISTIVTFVGMLAALIFMIILGVQLAFAGFERLVGEKVGLTAIKGTRALVQGRFWKTLWRLLVPKIIFGFAAALLQIIASLAVIALSYGLYAITQTTGDIGVLVIATFLSTGVAILTTPIFIIADYLLYDSLRKTK